MPHELLWCSAGKKYVSESEKYIMTEVFNPKKTIRREASQQSVESRRFER